MTASQGHRQAVVRRWHHHLDVFRVLFGRDLKVMYKRSALGFAWALALPLVQLGIYASVFRNALGGEIDHYPAYIFIGVLSWTWFASSLGEGVGLITANRALVGQPRFPLVILPHVTVTVRLFHFLIAVPLLFVLLWMSGFRPTAAWFALPLLILVQYLVIVALVFPLASLNVIHHDVQHATRVVLQLMLFTTPVFYRMEIVPDGLARWFRWNPMVGIMESWRRILMEGAWPEWPVIAKVLVAGLALYWVGRGLFVRQSGRFLEEL